MMRVLDLFSGIGGFSLGLERTGGFETVAFCEIDPFCRRVLAKHWPEVPCYDDVRELTAARLAADGIAVDVICGGFPCQDLSFAGKRAGLEGARSGLWGEYRRIIGEVRPRFVIVENVPGLLSLGMGAVLGDLSALGFDAVWDCVPAAAVGAPHRRDRVWVVAYAPSIRCREQEYAGDILRAATAQPEYERIGDAASARGCGADVPNAHRHQLRQQPGRSSGPGGAGTPQPGEHGAARAVADADKSVAGKEREQRGRQLVRLGRHPKAHSGGRPERHWLVEPDVGRVAHGVQARVDRLRALGNAVVPQIPEMIGRAILQAQ